MTTCPICHHHCPSGARFCGQCGLNLTHMVHPAGSLPPLSTATADRGRVTASLRPGTVLDQGRYSIGRTLSAGSFGTVYAAINHRFSNRPCAVKELHPQTTQSPDEYAESLAWFTREAHLLMDLHHPMIPRVWDQFTENNRFYLVMDLIPGQDLEQERTQRGVPFAEQEVLQWGVELCAVLSYLHSHRPPIIFRDLKPANIMRTPEGALFLIDFGIARVLDARGAGGTLRPGTLIGTPGYAPLEQYQGLADPRSDIYALGATLHTLLTGYDPQRGQPLSFPPVRQVRADLHAETEAVVTRAVQVKPADRYTDAATFARALTHAMTSCGPQARRKSTRTPRTTAPASLRSPVPLQRAPSRFGVGERVQHPTYGLGTVKKIVWVNNDEHAIVTFDAVQGVPTDKMLDTALPELRRTTGQTSGVTPRQATHLQPRSPKPPSVVTTTVVAAGTHQAMTLHEYPIPTVASYPTSLVIAPDGTLWFTEHAADKIGRLTPAGRMREFALKTPYARPRLIIAGPDRACWFTQENSAVGRINRTGTTSEFPTQKIVGLVAGRDGNLWATCPGQAHLIKMTPSGQTIDVVHLVWIGINQPVEAHDIIAGDDGHLWMVDHRHNRVGRLTLEGTLRAYALPRPHCHPARLASAPDGGVWFTEAQGNCLGRVRADGQITEYPIPTPASCPLGITVASDGTVWFTEAIGNKIGCRSPDGMIVEYALPTPNSHPQAIMAGPDGRLWFVESLGNKIGCLEP